MNKFIKNNSSTILTVIGSIGVGITAVMSARDTVRAMKKIEDESYQAFHRDRTVTLTKKEKIKLAAPCYIPTLLTGVATITCICGANKLNKNAQKSLAGAYMLLDRSYKEYRQSVKDVYGDEGELEVVKNVADKHAEEAELPVVNEDEEEVFFDFYNLKFFKSKLSVIRNVEEAANKIMQERGAISMRTVSLLMGEGIIDCWHGDELVGWSLAAGKVYGYDHIEFKIDKAVDKDGHEYYVLDYVDGPTEDYLHV